MLADIRFVTWRCIVQEIWSIQHEAHFQQQNIWESANKIFEDFFLKSRRRMQIVQKYGGSGKKLIFVHSSVVSVAPVPLTCIHFKAITWGNRTQPAMDLQVPCLALGTACPTHRLC